MKKVIILVCSSILFIGLTSFIKQDDKSKTENIVRKTEPIFSKTEETKSKDVREEVWNQLSTEDKKRVIGSWKDAKIRKIMLSQSMGNINDKNEIGHEVYVIDFQVKSNSIPNNMVVYADLEGHKLIGHGYVD
ncbi:hypothetical protein [Fictibacillus barbaricus]|uniref:DUF3887 domain-containing protein n=1 Tax=Fictibacillus barbaricus TaxID=182136 RepID=A0ABU1TWS7_9BACL|nr:hypothetical protein [Fictibacillus barbaricus]MDR7071674.1 hypothetical protein [Fictibacillus barbaricus]